MNSSDAWWIHRMQDKFMRSNVNSWGPWCIHRMHGEFMGSKVNLWNAWWIHVVRSRSYCIISAFWMHEGCMVIAHTAPIAFCECIRLCSKQLLFLWNHQNIQPIIIRPEGDLHLWHYLISHITIIKITIKWEWQLTILNVFTIANLIRQ